MDPRHNTRAHTISLPETMTKKGGGGMMICLIGEPAEQLRATVTSLKR